MKKYLCTFSTDALFCIAFSYMAVININKNGNIILGNQTSGFEVKRAELLLMLDK